MAISTHKGKEEKEMTKQLQKKTYTQNMYIHRKYDKFIS
jgi:hypothetical protein